MLPSGGWHVDVPKLGVVLVQDVYFGMWPSREGASIFLAEIWWHLL